MNSFDAKKSSIKKRGRPRKDTLSDKKILESSDFNSFTIKNSFVDNRELILHLPLFEKKKKPICDTENQFTCEETTPHEQQKHAVNNSDMLPESDDDSNDSDAENNDDSDIENNNDSDDGYESDELMDDFVTPNFQPKNNNKLKDKDKIIKCLRQELDEIKNKTITPFNVGNEPPQKMLSLTFIESRSGKTVICEKTHIACWWCTETFDNIPCMLPEKYHSDTFYVFGCFCSFTCAAGYNYSMGDFKVNDRYSLLKKMYNIITDTDTNIPIAPPREVLKKFGGNVDINVFRSPQFCMTKNCRLILPPMINLIPCIEEKNRDPEKFLSKSVN